MQLEIKRESILFELAWAYHRITFCAYWPMGWKNNPPHIAHHGCSLLVGPLQLSIGNRASGAEFQRALCRKRYGETLEERIRGAADFTLMSDWSSAADKANARAVLARMG